MPLSELAGKRAPADILIDVARLQQQYHSVTPDVENPSQRVAFGTSGHRGSAARGSFNEAHILAITQAICEHRRAAGIDGPLFIGMDTHALSGPAQETALEVLAAHGVEVRVAASQTYTPTPAVSHAILTWNRGRRTGLADGIVVTPSHNPPDDGGFKYNPPNGGPADTGITRAIEDRANEILRHQLSDVQRVTLSKAMAASTTRIWDFIGPYVSDLRHVIDMEVLRGLKLGVDPLGGASVGYWDPIISTYKLDVTVVNPKVDPTFAFMTVDHDGKIRMDCSSPYAMASLVGLRDRFQVAFGNDTDSDRHGIVTPSGLMNPNHYLAVAIGYLFQHRPRWRADAAVGKTLVSSAIIDRVAASLGRRLAEVPVGFKWFVDGLLDGSLGFGGEESAGASFLRHDGSVWTTDKDGLIMDLLAGEITGRTGQDPSEHYRELTARFGAPQYARIDAPANREQKAILSKLSPEAVTAATLAGDPIRQKLTQAPANGAAIGGLKVVTDNGWFAARPSGTEDVYKIYAESFRDASHLQRILSEAQAMVSDAFAAKKS